MSVFESDGGAVDFLNLLTVLRRHWIIMLFGVLAGLIVAFAVTFQRTPEGTLTKRSYTTYTYEMGMLVVDPRYGIGRGIGDQENPDSFNKTVTLANTYANLATSNAVRRMADTSVGPTGAEITAAGVQQAPVFKVTLKGTDALALERYGQAMGVSLKTYLQQQQDAQKVPKGDRMAVEIISSPRPIAESSRAWEMTLIAFLAPVLLAYGLALLRDRSVAARAGTVAPQEQVA
jgi:hypothetical protein